MGREHMEQSKGLEIYLDENNFRRFAFFDRYVRTGALKRPLIFLAVFAVLALIAFIAAMNGVRGAWLLGGVLLGIGLLLPVNHFIRFFSNLNKRVKQLGLDKNKKRLAYTLFLKQDPKHLVTQNAKQEQSSHSWKKMLGAWEHKGDVYVYVEEGKVYLIPGAVQDAQETMAFLQSVMPKEKVHR